MENFKLNAIKLKSYYKKRKLNFIGRKKKKKKWSYLLAGRVLRSGEGNFVFEGSILFSTINLIAEVGAGGMINVVCLKREEYSIDECSFPKSSFRTGCAVLELAGNWGLCCQLNGQYSIIFLSSQRQTFFLYFFGANYWFWVLRWSTQQRTRGAQEFLF